MDATEDVNKIFLLTDGPYVDHLLLSIKNRIDKEVIGSQSLRWSTF